MPLKPYQERPIPKKIGNYTIIRLLGEGGMGDVYLAERNDEMRRLVALKVLKNEVGKSASERFDMERDALAQMRHPNVAQVYNAGTTPEGFSYIAMEYVDGQSLMRFCDSQALNTEERLRLFVSICDGVQHAHYRGIIHRDLKPSNILISQENEQPLAKIIDFGIAKDTSHTTEDELTCVGELLGTPYYMSPEQAEGSDVDSRTDIYALGILLYELLTGNLPFAKGQGNVISYLQRVVHEASPSPSQRLKGLGQDGKQVALRRNINPQSLIKKLEGDLDWIVTKAIAKNREQRYSTASELGTDILNYLENKPVLASPPDPVYRLRKFIRRHQAGFAASLVGITSLIVALGISLNALVKVQESQKEIIASQQQALDEANRARAFGSVLENILTAADPERDGPQLTVVQLIERTLPTLGDDLGDLPEVEASLRHTLGQTLTSLSHFDLARQELDRAYFLRRQELGEDALGTLQSHILIAELALHFGTYDQALKIYQSVHQLSSTKHGPDHELSIQAHSGIAKTYYYQSKYQDAHDLFRPILDKQKQVFGEKDPRLFTNRRLYASSLFKLDFRAKAFSQFEELIADATTQNGEDHPDTLTFKHSLGNLYLRAKKFEEARIIYEEVHQSRERVLGPTHRGTLITINNLGSLYYQQRDYARAKGYYQKALELQKQTLNTDHPDVMMSQNNIANCLRREGKMEEARTLYEKTLAILDNSLGSGHLETVRTRLNLCKIHLAQKNVAALYRESQRVTQSRPEIGQAHLFLAQSHYMKGNIEAAERAFQKFGELSPHSFEYCSWHGLTQLILGQKEQAFASMEAAYANARNERQIQDFLKELQQANSKHGPLQGYEEARKILLKPRDQDAD